MVMNTLRYSISGLRLVICDKCVDVCNMNSKFIQWQLSLELDTFNL